MAGTYVFSALAMILGLLLHAADCLLQRHRRQPKAASQPAADVSAEVVSLGPEVPSPSPSNLEGRGTGLGLESRVERIEGQYGAIQAQLALILEASASAGEARAGPGGGFSASGSRRWTGRGTASWRTGKEGPGSFKLSPKAQDPKGCAQQ
eukprot:CAMPEP_0181304800 /NCGR_PEP_ID=MMETSP1101-20121128/9360_1 /TAXON_ID=46948 /ORGANISM="Rhodomonas abbreviata, Strain Caron Lab Isolate" /LENGTH=150 /DNA_ID=CAMNT_0023410615 /DNA_START=555 /DNA_END=1007 /DNA_ORIENTATION=-